MLTIEEKREKILGFFEYFVEGFIQKDLEILLSIKPNPETGLGGCTISTAMTIIASCELLGFILKKDGETGKSKENIAYFLNYDQNSLFPTYDGPTISKLFDYRHGMMHHFFPKFKGKFAGICKDYNNNNLFIYHNLDKNHEESLNVSVLANDFTNALKKLKQFLSSTNKEEIFDNIIKGLKDLDYYLKISTTSTTKCTTINPGTPKNKQ